MTSQRYNFDHRWMAQIFQSTETHLSCVLFKKRWKFWLFREEHFHEFEGNFVVDQVSISNSGRTFGCHELGNSLRSIDSLYTRRVHWIVWNNNRPILIGNSLFFVSWDFPLICVKKGVFHSLERNGIIHRIFIHSDWTHSICKSMWFNQVERGKKGPAQI